MPKQKFGDWLSDRLIERDMKSADLSRAIRDVGGNMDSGVVSNLINNKRQQPSVDTCKMIAKALKIPLEEVYRAASILPDKPDIDTLTESVINLMRDLQKSDKEDILEYARLRHKLSTDRPHVAEHSKRSTRRVIPT